jgi:hypothetical protein
MKARRLLRAVMRPLKRAIRPLRLRYLKHQIAASQHEIQRLASFRMDLAELEAIEHRHQVQLAARRIAIERGLA